MLPTTTFSPLSAGSGPWAPQIAVTDHHAFAGQGRGVGIPLSIEGHVLIALLLVY
jgi:hypothetical protein